VCNSGLDRRGWQKKQHVQFWPGLALEKPCAILAWIGFKTTKQSRVCNLQLGSFQNPMGFSQKTACAILAWINKHRV
jgi:hypothetical protein